MSFRASLFWDKVLFGLLVAALFAVLLGIDLAYARFAYGDWKCGLPGVHCRRVVR